MLILSELRKALEHRMSKNLLGNLATKHTKCNLDMPWDDNRPPIVRAALDDAENISFKDPAKNFNFIRSILYLRYLFKKNYFFCSIAPN